MESYLFSYVFPLSHAVVDLISKTLLHNQLNAHKHTVIVKALFIVPSVAHNYKIIGIFKQNSDNWSDIDPAQQADMPS
jgi:hypothetical protein